MMLAQELSKHMNYITIVESNLNEVATSVYQAKRHCQEMIDYNQEEMEGSEMKKLKLENEEVLRRQKALMIENDKLEKAWRSCNFACQDLERELDQKEKELETLQALYPKLKTTIEANRGKIERLAEEKEELLRKNEMMDQSLAEYFFTPLEKEPPAPLPGLRLPDDTLRRPSVISQESGLPSISAPLETAKEEEANDNNKSKTSIPLAPTIIGEPRRSSRVIQKQSPKEENEPDQESLITSHQQIRTHQSSHVSSSSSSSEEADNDSDSSIVVLQETSSVKDEKRFLDLTSSPPSRRYQTLNQTAPSSYTGTGEWRKAKKDMNDSITNENRTRGLKPRERARRRSGSPPPSPLLETIWSDIVSREKSVTSPSQSPAHIVVERTPRLEVDKRRTRRNRHFTAALEHDKSLEKRRYGDNDEDLENRNNDKRDTNEDIIEEDGMPNKRTHELPIQFFAKERKQEEKGNEIEL